MFSIGMKEGITGKFDEENVMCVHTNKKHKHSEAVRLQEIKKKAKENYKPICCMFYNKYIEQTGLQYSTKRMLQHYELVTTWSKTQKLAITTRSVGYSKCTGQRSRRLWDKIEFVNSNFCCRILSGFCLRCGEIANRYCALK